MHCPQCGLEYRAGLTTCATCRCELVAEPLPQVRLELVFESEEPVVIGMARAALEDAAIPFVAEYDETAARLTLAPPVMFPLCRIAVSATDAGHARDILGPLATRPR